MSGRGLTIDFYSCYGVSNASFTELVCRRFGLRPGGAFVAVVAGKLPSEPRGFDTGRWRLVALEIGGTAAIMAVYFLLRGIRPDSPDTSVSRSLWLINFEQRLGLFQEVRWQAAFLDYGWAITAANATRHVDLHGAWCCPTQP